MLPVESKGPPLAVLTIVVQSIIILVVLKKLDACSFKIRYVFEGKFMNLLLVVFRMLAEKNFKFGNVSKVVKCSFNLKLQEFLARQRK